MSEDIVNRLREVLKLEIASDELAKLPYKSYRIIVNRAVSGIKPGGFLESSLASTYVNSLKDLIIALMRVRILKILDKLSKGNVPHRNLTDEELRIVSAVEDLIRVISPKPSRGPARDAALVAIQRDFISFKTVRGFRIEDPMAGDLIVLTTVDALEVAKRGAAKVFRLRRVKVSDKPPGG